MVTYEALFALITAICAIISIVILILDFILESDKKVKNLFIAPEARQILHDKRPQALCSEQPPVGRLLASRRRHSVP